MAVGVAVTRGKWRRPGNYSLLTNPQTKIMTASGVVIASPTQLAGFIVVVKGTSATVKAWDNASAASGKLIGNWSGAQIDQGAFLGFNGDAEGCDNGVYVEISGGAVLLAIVDGDPYTAPSPVGTAWYFDGTNGSDANDGLAESRPKQTITNTERTAWATGEHTIYIKSGTTVLTNVTSDVRPTDNFQIRNYGGSAKGILTPSGTQVTSFNFIDLASGKYGYVSQITFQGTATTKASATATCLNTETETAQMIIEDVNIDSWRSGIRYTGDNSRFRRVRITNCGSAGNAIYAGKNGATGGAPSYCLFDQCHLDATGAKDGWTLHDGDLDSPGTGTNIQTGVANVIVRSTIYGGTENAVDILGGADQEGKYTDTLVAFCRIFAGTLYTCITSSGGDRTTFLSNIIRAGTGGAAIYNRCANSVLVGNLIFNGAATNNNGSGLAFATTATSTTVLNNTIETVSTTTRPVLHFDASGSTGTFKNNIINHVASTSRVTSNISTTDMGNWTFTNNCHYFPNRTADPFVVNSANTNWTAWTTTHSKDANSLNVNPSLSAAYELSTTSQLRSVGAEQTPKYLGINGVIGLYGAPSMGALEPSRLGVRRILLVPDA